MKKRKGKKSKFKISNRLAYTLIVVGFFISLGAIAYAATPGVSHDIEEIDVPAGCVDGDVLTLSGEQWMCGSAVGSGDSSWISISYNSVSYPGTPPDGCPSGWTQYDFQCVESTCSYSCYKSGGAGGSSSSLNCITRTHTAYTGTSQQSCNSDEYLTGGACDTPNVGSVESKI